jgi:hypothetical protein
VFALKASILNIEFFDDVAGRGMFGASNDPIFIHSIRQLERRPGSGWQLGGPPLMVALRRFRSIDLIVDAHQFHDIARGIIRYRVKRIFSS